MYVSQQAYLYLMIFLITYVINAIISANVYGAGVLLGMIIVFIVCIPFIALSVYNIDCLTTGGCEIWSWFLSIISIMSLIGTTIYMIVLALQGKKL
jgi:hypothetical protein